MLLCKICITLAAAVVTVCGACAQQVVPRIAGLEGNEEYMSLLREDARLQIREDSVLRAVNTIRQQFRDDSAKREQHARSILSLEEQIFTIRNSKGRLTDRITTIEQEWVISNLGTTQPGHSGGFGLLPLIPEQEKVRNLVFNRYFRDQLPEADYAALRKAQQQEMTAVDYINRYMANYQEINDLSGRYATAQTESEALELFGKYKTMQGLNDVLADSLAAVWNEVFDNKTYAYGYLLDKLGRDDILAREEKLLADAVRKHYEGRGQYASDAVSDYFLRKPVVADYETQIALLLKLDAARDSLRGVTTQLERIDHRLSRIEVADRHFIDYAPLTFTSPSKYTTENPIPECRVFRQGAVYRVQIGTFSAKRPTSVFKGVHPLCYQSDEHGKWRYFAGGFATQAEADTALKQLKAKGFVKPEVVVWRDGIYRNLTRDPEQTKQMYRVEIIGADALPEPVKDAIAASAPGHELSRVGQQMFVVGLFVERVEADRVAEAVRNAGGPFEIKVAEILKNPK